MKTLVILLLSILLTEPSFAAGRLQKITDGDPAPFSGYVIDYEQEQHFRAINENYKLEMEKNLKLHQLNRINEEETKYYKDSYLETRKELDKEQKSATIKYGLFFVGGILTALGVGWVILIAVP